MNSTATATTTDHQIPFTWWNNDNAFRSRLLDAFSLMIPSGERFLVATVNDWLQTPACDRASAELQQEAQRFVREELSHQRAHRLYNDRMAATAPVARQLEQRIDAAAEELTPWRLQTRIAYASAFENLTTILCTQMVRERNPWLAGRPSAQKRLWLWHAHEEMAHHQVVTAVMRAAGVSHGLRITALLASAMFLISDLLYCLLRLCLADVRAKRVSAWRLAAQAAGFAVQAAPSLLRMAGQFLRCLIGSHQAH
jgi:uncharacterized protein